MVSILGPHLSRRALGMNWKWLNNNWQEDFFSQKKRIQGNHKPHSFFDKAVQFNLSQFADLE